MSFKLRKIVPEWQTPSRMCDMKLLARPIVKLFRHFDKDRSKTLTFDELMDFINFVGASVSEEMLKEFIYSVQRQRNGAPDEEGNLELLSTDFHRFMERILTRRLVDMIASDIDNTLLPLGKKEVSARVISAVTAVRKNNIPFVLCTGRSLEMVTKSMPGLPYLADYVICNNGACIYKLPEMELINSQAIMPDICEQFMLELEKACADEKPLANVVLAMTLENMVATKGPHVDAFQELPGVDKVFKGNIEKVDNVHDIVGRRLISSFCISSDCRTPSEMEELLSELLSESFPALAMEIVELLGETPLILIMHRDASKGKACLRLAEYLKLPHGLANTMAFGDDLNDLSMMAEVGWGVAVRNAEPELRTICHEICRESSENGVARVLEQITAMRGGEVERVYGVVDQLVRENKLLEAKVQQLREMQQRAKL